MNTFFSSKIEIWQGSKIWKILYIFSQFVALMKKFNIKSPPQLVLFRNKEVLTYGGNLNDEDEVLSWLTDENTLEIPGKIEEVNMKMLDKILTENDHIVIFFCKFSVFFCNFECISNLNISIHRQRRRQKSIQDLK